MYSSVPFVRQGYQPTDDDYYIILDVNFKATQEEISQAYKNLARKYHPDKHNQDERSRREAELIFGKIKAAYDVLGDPRKRQIYDTLGPEGIKLDSWKLVSKQMTAQEIREEFLKIQKQRLDNKMALIAKPRASFNIAIDASDIFAKTKVGQDDDDEEDWDEEDGEGISAKELIRIPSIQVTSMSASMALDNELADNHSVALSGSVNSKNGTGDCSFVTNYIYKYSPASKFDLYYQFGGGPLLTAGINHQLSDKTNITARGLLLFTRYGIAPGIKLTTSYKIRNHLIGRVSYKEGIQPNVTTSLIYINERLAFEITTSYKLGKLGSGVSIEMGHRFNGNDSKLSISLAATTNQGVAVEYGCETRVLELNIIGATLSFSLPSGVTLKIRFNRANQEFDIPIYLSDEVHSAPIFYGTMVPLLTFYLIDRYYLRQYKRIR